MPDLAQLAVAIGVVFAINLLPAFGPPTWAVLVFFSLDFELPAVPLVLLGALAAASGRYLLASGTRRLRPRFSKERLAHIDRVQERALASRRRAGAGLGLFALSPVPSGQLFVGAGLMTVPLLPLTAAFFAGRLVSYSIYVAAANVAAQSLGTIVTDALTSPVGIGLQIAMLVVLAAVAGGLRPGGGRVDRSSAVVLPGCRGAEPSLDSKHEAADRTG
ncbi:MAG TPA: hypothetical protein VMS60_11415 [Solirubrobacterales bacterium]|nr:hypothetical protein [Solirubrobacterales bacterium]